MEKGKKEKEKITKTEWVLLIGSLIFAFLTFIGHCIVHKDVILSAVLTLLYLGLLILFVIGLRKVKTVETNFKTWMIVEIALLSVFVFFLYQFFSTPMNRTIKAYSDRNDLKERAEIELSNIEKALEQYKEKEEEAINKTINSLTKVDIENNLYLFAPDLKQCIKYLVLSNNEGEIDDCIEKYKDVLLDKFIRDKFSNEGYITAVQDKINVLKEKEWGLFNLYDIKEYSEKLDILYKEVERKLTEFSHERHPDYGPYKFAIKRIYPTYKFDLNDVEFEYDIDNDVDYDNRCVLLREVERIEKYPPFNFICIITTIMILFPYIMANRSNKIEIKRMYEKNKKNIGGIDL